ncbi:MAG: ribosome silencing factor [Clostridia bacterium]|nr:ribosome silencing factor [Clostridia bacterium]
MKIEDIAVTAAKALDAKRGKDIVVLRVDEMTVITDYMVIATGHSAIQVKSLAENVEEELAKQDVFAKRKEGMSEGRWIVLDYGDVMVHIFGEKEREYYRLEHLWSGENNRLEIEFDSEETEA